MMVNVLPVVMALVVPSLANGESQPVVYPVDDLVVDERLELTRKEQLFALRALQSGMIKTDFIHKLNTS
jgi:hypothetical protein